MGLSRCAYSERVEAFRATTPCLLPAEGTNHVRQRRRRCLASSSWPGTCLASETRCEMHGAVPLCDDLLLSAPSPDVCRHRETHHRLPRRRPRRQRLHQVETAKRPMVGPPVKSRLSTGVRCRRRAAFETLGRRRRRPAGGWSRPSGEECRRLRWLGSSPSRPGRRVGSTQIFGRLFIRAICSATSADSAVSPAVGQ